LRYFAEYYLKEEIFKKANGICQICKKNKAEQLHHKKYTKEIKDIIAICKNCHSDIHNKNG